jgi:hypothetical protein
VCGEPVCTTEPKSQAAPSSLTSVVREEAGVGGGTDVTVT